MKAIIFQKYKSVTQSPKNKFIWVLELKDECNSSKFKEKQMGWIGTKNTLKQVKISFDQLQHAIDFAESNNYDYEIMEQSVIRINKKSYASNFLR